MPTIETDDTGVWCQDGPSRRWGIRWDEVVRVTVGKIDAITEVWTSVELDFEFGEYVELSSGSPGFEAALDTICSQLPCGMRDWRERIGMLKPGDAPLVLWSRVGQGA